MWEALMGSAEPWAWAQFRALYQAVMMTPMMAPPTVATSSDHSYWRAWWRSSFQMSVTMFFYSCPGQAAREARAAWTSSAI